MAGAQLCSLTSDYNKYRAVIFVEPLGGIRHVSVRQHRTALDWAAEIKYLVDLCYPDRDRIILVMDNLNTHALSSLYKAFPAPEARRIAKNWKSITRRSMAAGWTSLKLS